jgi:hypothetical protein
MLKMLLIGAAVALLVTTGLFMPRPTSTAATQISASPSAFEMMSRAVDLPTAPHSDAI